MHAVVIVGLVTVFFRCFFSFLRCCLLSAAVDALLPPAPLPLPLLLLAGHLADATLPRNSKKQRYKSPSHCWDRCLQTEPASEKSMGSSWISAARRMFIFVLLSFACSRNWSVFSLSPFSQIFTFGFIFWDIQFVGDPSSLLFWSAIVMHIKAMGEILTALHWQWWVIHPVTSRPDLEVFRLCGGTGPPQI